MISCNLQVQNQVGVGLWSFQKYKSTDFVANESKIDFELDISNSKNTGLPIMQQTNPKLIWNWIFPKMGLPR